MFHVSVSFQLCWSWWTFQYRSLKSVVTFWLCICISLLYWNTSNVSNFNLLCVPRIGWFTHALCPSQLKWTNNRLALASERSPYKMPSLVHCSTTTYCAGTGHDSIVLMGGRSTDEADHHNRITRYNRFCRLKVFLFFCTKPPSFAINLWLFKRCNSEHLPPTNYIYVITAGWTVHAMCSCKANAAWAKLCGKVTIKTCPLIAG